MRGAAAARLIEQALAIKPDYIEALSNLAAIHRALGDTEASLAAARQAIALAPVAICEGIIARRPDSAEPYFSLGNILKELSQPGEAVEAYRRALALRPDFAEVYANIGNVLQGQEAFEAALTVTAEGAKPDKAKPFKGVDGGVFEIAVRCRGDAFRILYAVKVGADIWVIHAFQKKSKSGIKTPQVEVDLIRERLQRLTEALK
jgi:phage-related protein